MNIFKDFIKKLNPNKLDINLIKLVENKYNNYDHIFNSNIFAKIFRNHSIEKNFIKSRVLVLAPHPDDEVIGCGGSLEILNNQDSDIQLIYVTNGVPKKIKNFEEGTLIRKKEAQKLNIEKNFLNPIFFDLETRKLQYDYELKIDSLRLIIENFNPEIIFVPFVIDRVDDHIYTNKLLFKVLENLYLKKCEIFSYQVSNFINLNCYVDITKVFEKKINMMQFYKSVLKQTNYINLFKGLNLYNSFFVKKRHEEQEEFFEVFLRQSIEDYIHLCRLVFEK